ncbi:MAG: L,D-transpeptidase family protein [Myxococcales bacterium]|nr:L,D-transpeptidase family protein [Myxococcales bacterium]
MLRRAGRVLVACWLAAPGCAPAPTERSTGELAFRGPNAGRAAAPARDRRAPTANRPEPPPGAALPTSSASTGIPSAGEVPVAVDGARASQPAAVPPPPSETERRDDGFEAAFPLHGVVTHFLAQVFGEPAAGARVVGYMRRGTQYRASLPRGRNGCPGGWHEVPGGGFVCHGSGHLVGPVPQTFEPSPVPPALDDALPYAYAYTARDGVPQYWQLPTSADEHQVAAVLASWPQVPSSSGVPPDAGAPAAPTSENESTSRADAVEAPLPPGSRPEPSQPHVPAATDAGVPALPAILRTRMLRGFYVSVDGLEETVEGRRFVRTVRGAYVRESDLLPNRPPSSRGVRLGGSWQLPIAIVYRTGARRYARDPAHGRLIDQGTIERHTALRVADERLVVGDRVYVASPEGILVRDGVVRLIRRIGRPPGVPATARWIHVDLSDQSLVAYEGDEPVFATLVSSGKEGYATPVGLFRIQSKHVSTTMDDEAAPDGAYSIEDVPWTMYFHGNYALHGAFWHYTFGRTRSHGCVNLSPADARWLFAWSEPALPPGWHGVFADRRRPGSFVYVTE